MADYYLILRHDQAGGTPTVEDTLYEDRYDAIEDADEMQRRTDRRDRYVVYEMTRDLDVSRPESDDWAEFGAAVDGVVAGALREASDG